MLEKYSLANEEYILTRYQNILKKQGITTVEDILFNFPTKYDDYNVSSIETAVVDENIVLEGTVITKLTVNHLKTKLSAVVFQMEVEGRKIRCTIFNRSYLKNKINYGSVIRVQGKFFQNMYNFTVNNLIILDEFNRDIIPNYNVKEITDSKYIEIVEKVYRRYKNKIVETLPKEYLEKHGLLSMQETVKILHFGDKKEDIEKAIKRVKYEELLKYQMSMKYLHYKRQLNESCFEIKPKMEMLEAFWKTLPYELTVDQKKVINDIFKDLNAKYAMNRLLQGEVGSGKTVVAVSAILAAVSDGYQAALMCPTEILSQQHFETVKNMLSIFPNINIALLTGSTKASEKRVIIEGLKNGTINVAIGTHALFQKDVEYHALGIAIADEEHRFGVRQRVLIRNKGMDVNYLKMSATPIPRTLAISAYGDTDISIIKTMPANRKQVITKYVEEGGKKAVIEHMKKELANGHQIYVVTPLIDESEVLDTANATEIYENMCRYFDGITKVGLIHGRLKAEEKEEIMSRFLANEIGILVATSVIEVGVNVINATTIVVLGAERFGVATLHQLRGRVMRSDAVPYCFFIADKKTENSDNRLKMVESTTDGFTLAEYDLIHRGPGEFFGEKQSGSMNFKYCDIRKDSDLLEIANQDSEEIILKEEFNTSDEYSYLRIHSEENYKKKISQID